MDIVHHDINGVQYLLLLQLRVAWATIFQYIIEVLLLVCVLVECNTGREVLYQFDGTQGRLGKAIDITQGSQGQV